MIEDVMVAGHLATLSTLFVKAHPTSSVSSVSRSMREACETTDAARSFGRLSRKQNAQTLPVGQADVFRMIRRCAREAGISTKIGCHTFRATWTVNRPVKASACDKPEKAEVRAQHSLKFLINAEWHGERAHLC
jgi:hypothetical protein